ncbi:MAG: primosomal protein N' [Rikenellaceae bacterium]
MPYAEVIIPLAIDALYTYSVSDELMKQGVAVGSFVAVAIGKKKVVGAVVVSVRDDDGVEIGEENSSKKGKKREIKPVLALLYSQKVVTEKQLQFWSWIHEFYLLAWGLMGYSFLPSSLKPTTEFDENEVGELKFEFNSIFGYKEHAIISLHPNYSSLSLLEKGIEENKRAKKRSQLLIEIAEELAVKVGDGNAEKIVDFSIDKRELMAKGYSGSIISQLVESNILVQGSEKRETDYSLPPYTLQEPLNKSSDNSLTTKVLENYGKGKTLLIESQKDKELKDMLCRVIDIVLQGGGEVLFLTPLLNSANSYIELFKSHFGENMVVYDRKKSKPQLHQLYFSILTSSGGTLVVSSRMGVGLPFKNLQLLIVDREHDQLYQASEYELNFNGRDAAVYLAHLHKAQTLLLSSAPSVESLYNCKIGKYRLISEKRDFNSKIVAINRNNIAPRERKMYCSSTDRRYLSNFIITEIEKRAAKGEMSFLYQNRKGYATVLECVECGEAVQCNNCNTTLAYFMATNDLRCRYCGSSYSVEQKCKSCGSGNLRKQGVGTENVELKIMELFPHLRVVRVDADTMGKPRIFNEIVEKIEKKEVDIVIGTQIMLSLPKPENLTFVGVVNGDNLFSQPDYKASERAFQLLTLLRMLLIDSKNSVMALQMAEHEDFLQNFTYNNYNALFERELADRYSFGYPPFCRVITYRIEHQDEQLLDSAARRFSAECRRLLSSRVSDVVVPMVDKIQGRYIREVIIRSDLKDGFIHAKRESQLQAKTLLKGVRWRVTVV